MGAQADVQEIPAFPAAGRRFALERIVGPGEAAPSGRARLDAIVDWLQHVAYADVRDAGLAEVAVWVVRRTTLAIERFPAFGEGLRIETACSGHGALCAERRTRVRGDRGGAMEAVAVWVSLDPGTLRPVRSRPFVEAYGVAPEARRVRAHLHHPAPPAGAPRTPWPLRRADLDVAGHVNNAAYWRAIEEHLPPLGAGDALAAEVEHQAPAQAGPAALARDGRRAWLVGPGDERHASFLLDRPLSAPDEHDDRI